MEIEEILERLLGKIQPTGESREDEIRYKNIENYKKALNFIMSSLEKASLYSDKPQYSMQKIGKKCEKFLRDFKR